ncbi:hypothetical protein U9M48_031049 [Paspalum notatum var. saurae]|uniref:Uncharacterized protein n=1 Tax=Paspalum notatum var. saurae TaxID=547442 RepID=A0AAQ3U2C8_PASNO
MRAAPTTRGGSRREHEGWRFLYRRGERGGVELADTACVARGAMAGLSVRNAVVCGGGMRQAGNGVARRGTAWRVRGAQRCRVRQAVVRWLGRRRLPGGMERAAQSGGKRRVRCAGHAAGQVARRRSSNDM